MSQRGAIYTETVAKQDPAKAENLFLKSSCHLNLHPSAQGLVWCTDSVASSKQIIFQLIDVLEIHKTAHTQLTLYCSYIYHDSVNM